MMLNSSPKPAFATLSRRFTLRLFRLPQHATLALRHRRKDVFVREEVKNDGSKGTPPQLFSKLGVTYKI